MKKILILIGILYSINSFSQSTVLLRGDTIKVYKQGDTATLKVEGEVMITHYKAGSSNDSILTWDASSKKIKMRDATGIGGGSGSGTVNSGLLGKPAYYITNPNGTVVDDFAAVDYATSGTNVKITALNTTDIPLQLKAVSSQTANLLEFSSSGGTGDLGWMTKDGYFVANRVAAGGSPTSAVTAYGAFGAALKVIGNSGTIGASLELDALSAQGGLTWSIFSAGSGASVPAGAWAIYNNTISAYRMFQASSGEFTIGQDFFNTSTMFNVKSYSTSVDVARFHGFEDDDAVLGLWADEGDDNADKWFLASNKTSNDFTLTNNTTEQFAVISTGGVRMPEIAAPSTPASATAVIYPKSDGLWYGKDDAGVESRLSNLIQSKGLTLESPGSAEDFGMWKTQVAITVSSINAVVKGSSPSVTINIAFGSDITSLTNVFSAGTAITNTTTGQTVNSGFNDATIPAGSWVRLISTASSGTITQIEVTINYTED